MPNYRKVNNGHADVDESLFASNTKKRNMKGSNAVVISKADINRIKDCSVVRAKPSEDLSGRRDRDDARARKIALANERKEMMQKKDADRKRVVKSDIEVERAARERAVKEAAAKQNDDALDITKTLNTFAARAAAFTIRDDQLAEMERQKAAEKAYEARMDKVMELDRLKDLEKRDRVEQEKRIKRAKDREMIVAQVKQAERAKLLVQEKIDQENAAMLKVMKNYEAEDRLAEQKRQEEVQRTKLTVQATNAENIRRKEIMKQKEIEEDEAIRLYQARKDAKAALAERESQERARAKVERETMLMAQQMKKADTKSAEDEVRARRHMEQLARRDRERKRQEAEVRSGRVLEQNRVRAEQAERHQAMRTREAVMQKQEYENTRKQIGLERERERLEMQAGKKSAMEHREGLQSQISVKSSRRKAEQQQKFAEGEKLKQEFSKELSKITNIRDNMVEDFKKKGVNEKYLSEIMTADLRKLQMR